MKMVLLTVLISILTTGLSVADGSSNLVAYYVPFQIETYLPITCDNIKVKATKKIILNSERSKKELLSLLQVAPEKSPFDQKRVRLLLEEDGLNRKIFVDAGGGVLSGNEHYTLSTENLSSLKTMLEKLAK